MAAPMTESERLREALKVAEDALDILADAGVPFAPDGVSITRNSIARHALREVRAALEAAPSVPSVDVELRRLLARALPYLESEAPSLAAEIDAALEAPPPRPTAEGLDAAWAAAEAALPENGMWLIEGVSLVDTSDSEDLNDEQLEWEAEAVDHRRGGQPTNITALGPTPAAALLALAARLSDHSTEPGR